MTGNKNTKGGQMLPVHKEEEKKKLLHDIIEILNKADYTELDLIYGFASSLVE